MRLQVEAEFGLFKSGEYARAPRLGLVGHGRDREEAREALSSIVAAWCEGLNQVGALSKALQRAKLEPLDTAPGFQIELI
jgi:hypothetical protein